MLKPFLLISAVAMVLVAPLTVPAQQPAAKGSAKPQAQEKAKALYKMDCALCHGENGNGKTDIAKDMSLTMVDWTDPKSLADRQDQELFGIIRNGKGKMPAEDASRAKDEEVRNLILYIRSMSKDQPAAAPAAPAAPVADATPAPNQ
ncbi:MAG: cytochrome c [Terracidiphilus sp.]